MEKDVLQTQTSAPGGSAAWLDIIQGGSGLLLTLFMWGHMVMVSSILLGEDAMYFVARLFEGEPLFGKPYPALVATVVAIVLALFLLHAVVAIRRIPNSYREYQSFQRHAQGLRHGDTHLWMLQVITGLLLMFFASAHLYQMLMHPGDIGPYASADRVWSGNWWPFYLIILFAVELHGGVGIYRLAIKWGWFTDRQGRIRRRGLKRLKWCLTGFFIVLGLLTLAAYMKIGFEHRDNVGQRYQPQVIQSSADK